MTNQKRSSTSVSSSSTGNTLRLFLSDKTNLSELAQQIYEHTSLMTRELILEPEWAHCGQEYILADVTEPDWTTPAAGEFFQVLGDLPELQKIHLKGLGFASSQAFPLHLLTALLVGSPMRSLHLKQLHVDKCRLGEVTQHTVLRCAEAMESLTNLKRVQWYERTSNAISFVKHNHDNNGPVLANAILSLPNLEGLQMGSGVVMLQQQQQEGEDTMGQGVGSNEAVGNFVLSSACRELSLRSFPFNGNSLLSLATALQSPTCRLETLELDLSRAPVSQVKTLFQALGTNTSLRTIQLWISYAEAWREAVCLETLAHALERNHHISTVRLYGPGRNNFDEHDATAFCKMLETNSTITTLALDDYNANHSCLMQQQGGKLAPMIQFYTHLNSCGRAKVLQRMRNFTMPQWMHVLAECKDTASSELQNLEAVHFWLRQNPTLIIAAASSDHPTTSAEC